MPTFVMWKGSLRTKRSLGPRKTSTSTFAERAPSTMSGDHKWSHSIARVLPARMMCCVFERADAQMMQPNTWADQGSDGDLTVKGSLKPIYFLKPYWGIRPG